MALLANPASVFASMVAESGEGPALRAMAAAARGGSGATTPAVTEAFAAVDSSAAAGNVVI